MYNRDVESEKILSECMEALKNLNKMFKEYENKTSKNMGINRIFSYLKNFKVGSLKQMFFKNYRMIKISHKKLPSPIYKKEISKKINYFSQEKIVIYTVIFGNYDSIQEPLFAPDNCEFIILTDMELPKNSKWKKYDMQKIASIIQGMTSIEKNRIFKMKPQILFPEYKYSIYIDGNIQIISDLTEMVHKIPECGVAMHWHAHRICVYDEIETVRLLKLDKKINLDKHMEHILEDGMPNNYGLLECNVIAREHNKESCKKLMEDWWKEFQIYSKRDQISFPYVLYKNGIKVKEVATLGHNVKQNYALRINSHKK